MEPWSSHRLSVLKAAWPMEIVPSNPINVAPSRPTARYEYEWHPSDPSINFSSNA